MQTHAGFEIQSVELLRREGEQDLTKRLSAIERYAARIHQLREVEVAIAEEREVALGRLEANANDMHQRGTDLRRFANKRLTSYAASLPRHLRLRPGSVQR